MWFSKSHFQPQGKVALIVGGSQGVGADLALRLCQQNCTVVLVARTESKLQEQVERISAQTKDPNQNSELVHYYACDAAEYTQCQRLWEHVLHTLRLDPDYIFCCAGLSIPKLFGDLSGPELQTGMTVNYLTAVNSVHAGFKAVAETSPGPAAGWKQRHVVLFSLTVSSFPFIGYAQYAPAKAAILSLSVILRQELLVYNYRVSCVYPGNFMSEGYLEEQKTKPEITRKIEGASNAIPSLQCADMVLDGLAKGYDSIYTDFIGWVLASLALGVFPRCWGLFQVLVSFLFSIVAPVAMLFIYLDIRGSHKKSEKCPKDDNAKED